MYVFVRVWFICSLLAFHQMQLLRSLVNRNSRLRVLIGHFATKIKLKHQIVRVQNAELIELHPAACRLILHTCTQVRAVCVHFVQFVQISYMRAVFGFNCLWIRFM
jgi:hypothetical protein